MKLFGKRRLPLLPLLAAIAAMAASAWWGWLRVQQPFDLAYEIDLTGAPEGRLDITLSATGQPPRSLRLVQPGGLFHEAAGGITLSPIAAWNFTLDGGRGAPLRVRQDGRAWIVSGTGQGGAVRYRVDLPPAGGADPDIRAHLSTRAGAGFRAAGFHLFLVPEDARLGSLSVRFTGGPGAAGERLAAPWRAEGAPDGIVLRPVDATDLTDALVAWGDLRLHEQDVGGCAVRLAMRGDWAFSDTELARLLLRLGETEIAFFGAAPYPSLLVLVDVNPLPPESGFPYYGLHVGHSVLLLLDPAATYPDLADKVASVAAHEMFHGWLGEEIRQRGQEMNWFVEGATSWYTARLLVASGVWSAQRAEEVVGGRVDAHYVNSPLRGRETIAAAARGLLRDGETTRYAYAGGTAAAAGLDAWLAERTGRDHPLDDVLRDLYARRADGPLTRRTLEAAVRRRCGVNCAGWLDRHVYGNEPLPRPVPMF